MADYSDLAAATKAVADPTTSAADLAQIASWHAKLQQQVAAHPNADPDLLSWLGVDLAQPATARQTQVTTAPEPQPAPRHAAKPSRWPRFGRRAVA